MKRKFVSSLLILVLLMGIAGTSLAASTAPPLPFGEHVVPLSQEEMEDVEGAWGAHATAAVIGGAIGGAFYWANTAPAERNWSDGLKACAQGALGALVGRYL